MTGDSSAEVWVKMEAANPPGSYKDRMALAMIVPPKSSARPPRIRPPPGLFSLAITRPPELCFKLGMSVDTYRGPQAASGVLATVLNQRENFGNLRKATLQGHLGIRAPLEIVAQSHSHSHVRTDDLPEAEPA
jgi:hypothetical protein